MTARRTILSAVALTIGLTAGGLLWSWSRPPVARVDPGQQRALLHFVDLKNTALAALENGDFKRADPQLLELATAGIAKPFGSRNLVINRVTVLAAIDERKNPQEHERASQRASTAADLEWAIERNGPMRSYLASKIASLNHDSQRQIFDLRMAATLAPDDPVLLYEFYLAERDAAEPSIRRDGEDALKTLSETVPENLYVLLQWMKILARRKDATISQICERARVLLDPILAGGSSGPAADVRRRLAETAAAVKADDWAGVERGVTAIVAAAAVDPVVRSDQRRVERGPLWYLLLDLPETFYNDYSLDRTLPSEPVAVRLQALPIEGPLAELNDVRDAKFVDFDRDGRLDAAVLRASSFEIYRRADSDKAWTRLAGILLPSGGFDHVLAVDLGQSADPDFILFGPSGVLIVENRLAADGKSRDLRPVDSPRLQEKTRGAQAVATLDLDEDGDLDLVIARIEGSPPVGGISIWRNTGKLAFDDITPRSGADATAIRAGAFVAADWDHDLDVDVVAAGGSGAAGVGFLKGRGAGRFHFEPIKSSNSAFDAATTLAVVDSDANGSLGLLTAGPRGMALMRTHSNQAGQLRTIRTDTISDFPAECLLALDYDNDGCQDVIAWNRDEVHCFHGGPLGRFDPAPDVLPADLKSIVAMDSGDVDADGDSDLLVVTRRESSGRLQILQNEGGNANNWIDVCLEGSPPAGEDPHQGRVNSAGIGCLLQLKTGAACQSQVVRQPRTHFGLGRLEGADVLRIVWTTGNASDVERPAKNRTVNERPSPRVLRLDPAAPSG